MLFVFVDGILEAGNWIAETENFCDGGTKGVTIYYTLSENCR